MPNFSTNCEAQWWKSCFETPLLSLCLCALQLLKKQ